jgi:hypothetical protein
MSIEHPYSGLHIGYTDNELYIRDSRSGTPRFWMYSNDALNGFLTLREQKQVSRVHPNSWKQMGGMHHAPWRNLLNEVYRRESEGKNYIETLFNGKHLDVYYLNHETNPTPCNLHLTLSKIISLKIIALAKDKNGNKIIVLDNGKETLAVSESDFVSQHIKPGTVIDLKEQDND